MQTHTHTHTILMYTHTHTLSHLHVVRLRSARPWEREGGRESQQFVGPTWKAVPKLTLKAHYDICAQFAGYISTVWYCVAEWKHLAKLIHRLIQQKCLRQQILLIWNDHNIVITISRLRYVHGTNVRQSGKFHLFFVSIRTWHLPESNMWKQLRITKFFNLASLVFNSTSVHGQDTLGAHFLALQS